MWSYYGAKTNLVNLYPPPKYGTIIEPFAGSARYALRYFDREVILADKYDVIVKIWKWLQVCSEKDVLSLPRIKAGDNINSFSYDCEEARLLMGFTVGFGFTTPRDLATVRLRDRPGQQQYTLNRIASSLFKIRHWDIRHCSYEEIENKQATWFIDPPYQVGGHCYKHSNKKIDFESLGSWCKERSGQVIVCESTKATWLPFTPMIEHNVLSGSYAEAIWTNQPTSIGQTQHGLFDIAV